MKTLRRSLLSALAAMLAACSTTATLTPISGPMAGASDIVAKIEGISGNSGTLSFTLASGERVSGRWQAVPGRVTKGAAVARGDRGSVFDVEFETDAFARGFGKATDNRGNSYRVLVRGI